MKKLINLLIISVVMTIMAFLFIDGLERELDLREHHARIHWRSK